MKKLFAIAALAFGLTSAALAHPRAIGARCSLISGEFSYQHNVVSADFLPSSFGSQFVQAELGWSDDFFAVHCSYNVVFANPDWSEGTWNAYLGPSAGLLGATGFGGVSIGAMIGLEYTFASIPLQLSVDARPDIIILGNNGFDAMRAIYPAFSVRYAF